MKIDYGLADKVLRYLTSKAKYDYYGIERIFGLNSGYALTLRDKYHVYTYVYDESGLIAHDLSNNPIRFVKMIFNSIRKNRRIFYFRNGNQRVLLPNNLVLEQFLIDVDLNSAIA